MAREYEWKLWEAQMKEAKLESQFSHLEDIRLMVAEVRDLLVAQKQAKDHYSVTEAADYLGKAAFTIREWCRLKRVHASKKLTGRGRAFEWVISHEELLRFRREGLLPLVD